nr:TPA_asm: hypothetical protein HUJ06_015908 [Nelumbo nucifera]
MQSSSTLLLIKALLFVVGLAQVHVSLGQTSPVDFLKLQNTARAKVGVDPLRWDPKLEEYAQNYAMQVSRNCKVVYSDGPYGENIYCAKGLANVNAATAVKAWEDEKKYYDYDSNSCIGGHECRHFVQLVF